MYFVYYLKLCQPQQFYSYCQMFATISSNSQSSKLSHSLPPLTSKNTTISYQGESQLSQQDSLRQMELKQKINKIALMNLKDHDKDICACQQCIYGRQLNRKRLIGLELSKSSSYRQAYVDRAGKKSLNNSEGTVNQQQLQRNRKGKSLTVDLTSMYHQKFPEGVAVQKPIKAHPTDELRFKGPIKSYSSYEEEYPSFKNNANPYIKPSEVTVSNNLKLNARSIYQQNFVGAVRKPEESGKIPDSLRGGLPWTGSSTYKQLYQTPLVNPQISQRYDKSRERRDDGLQYSHQYETTYRNQYAQDLKQRCRRRHEGGNRLVQSLTLPLI